MTDFKYMYDPPLVKGLYSVYMAGSIECAFSQHPDCMEADGCLFHKGASGCRIEYFYSDKCRSEQAATVIRALMESNRDFPEEIFVADPEYEYNSGVWGELTDEQKDALRKAYAEAREKLHGGKKIMVVDPGHDEGSRAAAAACKVQGGALIVQDMVDTKDISPNFNGDVMQLYLNSLKGLGEDKSIEIIPADETARIRSGITADSTEIDGAIDILEHWDKVTKEFDFVEGYNESCTLTRKSLRALRRSWGLDGKSRKRLRKKQEQEINHRDRIFRDRTRKLKRLLEYQIRSLEFVFQGPPFGNKNPVITMDRRYAFPEMNSSITEQIKRNAFDFLGLE